MNMADKDISIVQKAISFFSEGDYIAAKACYIKASELFGEQLFINNIKICELRLQQLAGVQAKNSHVENFFVEKINLKKGSFQIISELAISNTKDLLEIELVSLTKIPNLEKIKFLVLFDFFDSSGKQLKDVKGIGISAVFNKFFRYCANDNVNKEGQIIQAVKTQFSENVASCKIYIAAVGLTDEDDIFISLSGSFIPYSADISTDAPLVIDLPKYPDNQKQAINNESAIKQPINRTPKKRTTKDLNIACILDEFTTECLDHEVNLIKITQDNWLQELKTTSIDFLLIESCWRGNADQWGTLTQGSGAGKKLGALLKYCKGNGIPTVFWNKEDPPHYDKFAPVAKMFDHVITTDINMVPSYKQDYGIDAYPLSFAAQPKIHHPNSSIKRLNKAVFAGSYYGDKPKRCSDFNNLMNQLKQAGVGYDIYDRNYNRDIEKFKFPHNYNKYIVGNLPADEMWKAHQGYKYQINMNTVQNSKTMFARRVYESLASGTPVISNSSIGVEELFGDIVLFSEKGKGLVTKLRDLEKSPRKYKALAKNGVRSIMRKHTYAHRIQEICCFLNIPIEVEYSKAVMSAQVSHESEIEKVISIFSQQTAINKHLYVMMDNFDSAHHYLNKSTSEISYAMNFSPELYPNKVDLYKSNHILDLKLGQFLKKEDLEDFSYWGEL